jgi:hypothetical protein
MKFRCSACRAGASVAIPTVSRRVEIQKREQSHHVNFLVPKFTSMDSDTESDSECIGPTLSVPLRESTGAPDAGASELISTAIKEIQSLTLFDVEITMKVTTRIFYS